MDGFSEFAKNHTKKECKLVADTICFTLTHPGRAELMMGYLRSRMKSR